MKKNFIAAFAILALVGCNSAENTEETQTANTPSDSEATEVTTETTSEITPLNASHDVAYVDAMYVLAECDITKAEGTALQSKIEKAQQKFAKKEQNLQKEMQDLAEKYQKGLITTRDAQTKEQDLQKRATTLQNQIQKEIPALQEEEQVFNNRLNDLLLRAVQEINADKKYKMVVNIASLLDADSSLDITKQVLAKMNELYAAEK